MNINLENSEKHTIQRYSETQIEINSVSYETSFIVSREHLITDIPIHHINELNEKHLDQFLPLTPELIIIGHNTPTIPPSCLLLFSAQHQIGIECMSIGAACRTYNVLLGEGRHIVAGFILA